jgi:flavin reductase (DIM6/NTAB) family NADH-FMN oxidoreductase RutF
MDEQAKKTSLRMLPYGLYVLTGESKGGQVVASTVNWVTQASFEPPLVAVGVKVDTDTHTVIQESRCFALNVLSKGQQAMAFSFFKSQERDGNTIGGEAFSSGETGAPLLENALAVLDCRLVDSVEKGDHSLLVGEVVDAAVRREFSGRPDLETLTLLDLGEKTFYGG